MIEKIITLIMAMIIALGIYSNIKLREENKNNMKKQKKEMIEQCNKQVFENKYKEIFKEIGDGTYKIDNNDTDINFSIK